jgi:hypothetical protein
MPETVRIRFFTILYDQKPPPLKSQGFPERNEIF